MREKERTENKKLLKLNIYFYAFIQRNHTTITSPIQTNQKRKKEKKFLEEKMSMIGGHLLISENSLKLNMYHKRYVLTRKSKSYRNGAPKNKRE